MLYEICWNETEILEKEFIQESPIFNYHYLHMIFLIANANLLLLQIWLHMLKELHMYLYTSFIHIRRFDPTSKRL